MPFKLAVIGLGKITKDQHLPIIAKNGDFELTAVVSSRAPYKGMPSFKTPAELFAPRARCRLALHMPHEPRIVIARDTFEPSCTLGKAAGTNDERPRRHCRVYAPGLRQWSTVATAPTSNHQLMQPVVEKNAPSAMQIRANCRLVRAACNELKVPDFEVLGFDWAVLFGEIGWDMPAAGEGGGVTGSFSNFTSPNGTATLCNPQESSDPYDKGVNFPVLVDD
jgi:hypothetical protein